MGRKRSDHGRQDISRDLSHRGRNTDNHDQQWGLVLAGAADFARPAESLSLSQNVALMATGSIWTRWCFVIKPKNMLYVYTYHSLLAPDGADTKAIEGHDIK